MNAAEFQARVDGLTAQLAEIDGKRRTIRADIEDARQQLSQARSDLDDTHRQIKAGAPIESDDLMSAVKLVNEIEATLAELEQQAAATLPALDEQAKRLEQQIWKVRNERERAQLGEAVMAYQDALRTALPLADEIIKLAGKCGVTLPPRDIPSVLIRRGTHVVGGIVIELRTP